MGNGPTGDAPSTATAATSPPSGPAVADVRSRALAVLVAHWDPELRATLPHPVTYPHRWLWDSCFHVIAWTALGRPEGRTELRSVLSSALPTVAGRGFLPHMVFGDPRRDGDGVDRGRLRGMSSFTQPPVHVLALEAVVAAEGGAEPWMLEAAADGLEWLWAHRLHDGLLTIVHPWESGADISPRWDDWYRAVDVAGSVPTLETPGLRKDATGYDAVVRLYDRLVKTADYDAVGVAVSNPAFVAAPSAFNAIAADAARRLADLTGSTRWRGRAADLAAAIDAQLWDGAEQMWLDRRDQPADLDATSARIPTVDGVVAALATPSAERAEAALRQCVGSGRLAAPYGPRFLPADHPAYDPDLYWRGPTWPQLNYLLVLAARQHGLDDIADELVATTVRGAWASGFSEYWNPESGDGRGATPQSWTAVVAALLGD